MGLFDQRSPNEGLQTLLLLKQLGQREPQAGVPDPPPFSSLSTRELKLNEVASGALQSMAKAGENTGLRDSYASEGYNAYLSMTDEQRARLDASAPSGGGYAHEVYIRTNGAVGELNQDLARRAGMEIFRVASGDKANTGRASTDSPRAATGQGADSSGAEKARIAERDARALELGEGALVPTWAKFGFGDEASFYKADFKNNAVADAMDSVIDRITQAGDADGQRRIVNDPAFRRYVADVKRGLSQRKGYDPEIAKDFDTDVANLLTGISEGMTNELNWYKQNSEHISRSVNDILEATADGAVLFSDLTDPEKMYTKANLARAAKYDALNMLKEGVPLETVMAEVTHKLNLSLYGKSGRQTAFRYGDPTSNVQDANGNFTVIRSTDRRVLKYKDGGTDEEFMAPDWLVDFATVHAIDYEVIEFDHTTGRNIARGLHKDGRWYNITEAEARKLTDRHRYIDGGYDSGLVFQDPGRSAEDQQIDEAKLRLRNQGKAREAERIAAGKEKEEGGREPRPWVIKTVNQINRALGSEAEKKKAEEEERRQAEKAQLAAAKGAYVLTGKGLKAAGTGILDIFSTENKKKK